MGRSSKEVLKTAAAGRKQTAHTHTAHTTAQDTSFKSIWKHISNLVQLGRQLLHIRALEPHIIYLQNIPVFILS